MASTRRCSEGNWLRVVAFNHTQQEHLVARTRMRAAHLPRLSAVPSHFRPVLVCSAALRSAAGDNRPLQGEDSRRRQPDVWMSRDRKSHSQCQMADGDATLSLLNPGSEEVVIQILMKLLFFLFSTHTTYFLWEMCSRWEKYHKVKFPEI